MQEMSSEMGTEKTNNYHMPEMQKSLLEYEQNKEIRLCACGCEKETNIIFKKNKKFLDYTL